TRKLDSYVMKVKNLPEVEAGYMTLGDWIDIISEDIREDMREEVTKEVTEAVTREVTKTITEEVSKEIIEKDMKAFIEMVQEYRDTKENAVDKLRNIFPEYADQAEEMTEKYWQN
ncbi:MAG: hypothetical protein HDR18_04145, partial [Lachnospiraceae bacterium]|nr:hypothetical protein [Lachnospiraceae bacterium]